MPCRDFYDEQPQVYYAATIADLRKQVSFAESALCQTLAAFENHVAAQHIDIQGRNLTAKDLIDYEEAGITRAELELWHVKHKALDEEHRAKEKLAKAAKAAEKAKATLRKELLAKLTDEEKEALGVK